MNKDLKLGIIAALENRPSTSFSAEEVNEAAVKAIKIGRASCRERV